MSAFRFHHRPRVAMQAGHQVGLRARRAGLHRRDPAFQRVHAVGKRLQPEPTLMVENTCSTSDTETAIAGLHQWLPRDDGLAWAGVTITHVQVARRTDGFVALAFLRDGVVLHSVSISEAGAQHLAGLLAGPSAGA